MMIKYNKDTDCKHAIMWTKCQTCIDEVVSSALEQSQRENTELKTRVARLESILFVLLHRLQERFEFVPGQISTDLLQQQYEKAVAALNETPQQSLNEINEEQTKRITELEQQLAEQVAQGEE